jgi:hypothetical protein
MHRITVFAFYILFLPSTIILSINKSETLHLLHAQNAYNFSEFLPAYHAGAYGKQAAHFFITNWNFIRNILHHRRAGNS